MKNKIIILTGIFISLFSLTAYGWEKVSCKPGGICPEGSFCYDFGGDVGNVCVATCSQDPNTFCALGTTCCPPNKSGTVTTCCPPDKPCNADGSSCCNCGTTGIPPVGRKKAKK